MAKKTTSRCTMFPDPCPREDVIVQGTSAFGDHYVARLHRRAKGVVLVEAGDLREDSICFATIDDAIDFLDGDYLKKR